MSMNEIGSNTLIPATKVLRAVSFVCMPDFTGFSPLFPVKALLAMESRWLPLHSRLSSDVSVSAFEEIYDHVLCIADIEIKKQDVGIRDLEIMLYLESQHYGDELYRLFKDSFTKAMEIFTQREDFNGFTFQDTASLSDRVKLPWLEYFWGKNYFFEASEWVYGYIDDDCCDDDESNQSDSEDGGHSDKDESKSEQQSQSDEQSGSESNDNSTETRPT
ncbi:hypothetical protein AUEXF2481DRAFT_214445 [Aureobasidium subglaciale EXF-2481]|uniref:Uncharacterized protein n=1 Tax=Aureobasidium subglaciale (strain EXF-2481) TaxID=1043005 RepID=A0A074YGW7_AURSE|nr:uncharacterized protein AUEXF2481DRAFT_214445 [Aureobasidium subglaciale EXF-2481]KEQ95309.1 hypothetical protein AUEXF2481DRAFT_214445 [Aureobasidium subglaciale EXF-2481]